MDAVVCKTSSEEIQEGILKMSSQSEGLMSVPTKLLTNVTNRKSEILEKFSMEEKLGQNINGCIGENAHKFDVNKSSNMSNSLPQKSLSPTLIEHAFQVVKNIFSPEKNRNRPSKILSSMSQNPILSGSPCSSVYVQSPGTESPASEFEMENSERFTPIENSSKGDGLCLNQWELTPNSLNSDGHNNSVTDDSFLTTASLIEDSFQSAVTHIDENKDLIKGEIYPSAFILDNSQNSNSMYPSNDTFSGSECGLENTVLKNGSFSVESKPDNLSDDDKENILNRSQNGNVEEKKEISDGKEVVLEDPREKAEGDFELVPAENDVETSGNNPSNDSEVEEKEVETFPEQVSSALENKEKTNCENPRKEITKTAVSFLNESNVNVGEKDSVKSNGNFKDAEPLSSDISKADNEDGNGNRQSDEVSSGNCTDFSEEVENETDSNISTTTIILAESLSESDNLPPLKLPLEGIERSLEKPSPPLEKLIEDVANDANPKRNGEEKNPGKPGGGHGNSSSVKGSRSKLNKSIDSVSRKNFYNSPKGKKNFRQKMTEEFVLNLPKGGRAEESFDYFPAEAVDIHKTCETQCEVNERGDKMDSAPEMSSPLEVTSSNSSCFLQDSISLSSQQSYTILCHSDNNLKRPVIKSFEDFDSGWYKSTSQMSTAAKDLEIRKTFSDFTNKWSNNLSTETINFVSAPKQLTPMTNSSKTVCIKECNLGNSKMLNFGEKEFGEEEEEEEKEREMAAVKGGETTWETAFSPVGGSIVLPGKEKSKEMESTPFHKTFILNRLSPTVKPADAIYPGEYDEESAVLMLNQKYDSNSLNSEYSNLNETYYVKGSASLNPTCERNPNRTFEVKSESPSPNSKLKFDQTFEKGSENPLAVVGKGEECPKVTKEDQTGEGFIEPRACPTTILDQKFSNGNIAGDLSEKGSDKECLNSSFISTTSSNTSLLCNGNVTVLPNRGSSGRNNRPVEEFSLGSDSIKTCSAKECDEWADTLSMPSTSSKESDRSGSGSPRGEDGKSDDFFKMEKLQCDSDLVQFIREKFTSTDIEKICNFVEEDFSVSEKNSLPVVREEEEEEEEEGKMVEIPSRIGSSPQGFEGIPEKTGLNPLSPHCFDFLNSIGGKPTGRDLSRESLYVKFDPLVSAPNGGNSLIDFTKEVEAVPIPESSAEGETAVEHLLTISPEEKKNPDEIVPPLTPLSQKNQISSPREEKIERLRELQNEIYFLKNLYAERERTNKVKMDGYETQIARLTGQSCILEEKLKESGEREKCLVKKLQEQNRGITQLKTIVEEYAKVISKLTLELENVRRENQKRLIGLNMEKNSYVTHLQNTEAAFADVHAKYEKSKKTILSLKANEATFRNTIAEQSQKLEEYMERAREAQEKARREFQRIQEELAGAKATHSQESARLKAQLRKTELKLDAVRESLDQKIKENQQLTAICDELIEGKK